MEIGRPSAKQAYTSSVWKRPSEDRVSDGTLLLGTYDEILPCSWEVAREKVGIVRFDGDSVVLEWPAEWVTASVCDANAVASPVPQALPLFPDLDRWAA